ncbi:MAG: hypothetical protein QOF82_1392 [Frankiales bacterium]|jgi:glutathione S-transferase|nr:hypothetical protein [Frankiales bacterium]MDX6212305.1 hypothetical protein [Frankiales bacterium]
MIFHVSSPEDWQAAQQTGDYRNSTRGRTLEDEGFIHCSRLDQVAGVLAAYYTGAGPLLLLSIEPSLLSSPWREDEVAPGVFYPHVYGPLDLPAVVAATPLAVAEDGSYIVPSV